MASTNPIFPYYLFGIYIIELGRLFKQKFASFKIIQSAEPITCQVFFGTPRAAFRYYFEKYNGLVKMPMLSYHLPEIERKIEFEPAYVQIVSRDSFDPNTGKMQASRNPGVFELNFSFNLFNNNDRERDFMMHAIFNTFPRGETHLIYYPDFENHPEIYLQMPYKMELTATDETELEGLEPKETRDRIRTTFNLRCMKAFVPYEAYEVDVVNYISFSEKLNDFIGNTVNSIEFYNQLRMADFGINAGAKVNSVTAH